MPFKSKKQMRAAFGGYLGHEMKEKASEWADETPDIKNLPLRRTKVRVQRRANLKQYKSR